MRDAAGSAAPASGDETTRPALIAGVACYTLWGLMPLLYQLMSRGGADAGEMTAHRALWSVLWAGLLVLLAKQGGQVWRVLRQPRTVALLTLTSLLIGANWVLFVWAVSSGRTLEASLGYYINPLLNVLLGVVVLRERLRPAQVAATLIAAAGVAVLASGGAAFWVSLTLAVGFAVYGLVRKLTSAAALEGLAVETAVLAPVAAAYLLWLGGTGGAAFGSSAWLSVGLALSGAATVAPLFLFNAAARGLRYSTLGIVQYLGPTIQFVLAAALFGEQVTRAHAGAFGAIWLACAIYAADALRAARRAINERSPPALPE